MLVASRAATQWILCCSAVSQLRGFTCAAPRLRVMAQPLPMLMREIRNKSRRLRRLQAQTAAFGDASSPGPRLSARAMHVYTLTGCSNAAACYLAWAADTCSASLAELTLVVDSLLAQPRGSRTNARDVLAAAGFVLQRRLWEWIHNQNVQRGVAPSRAMLVERAAADSRRGAAACCCSFTSPSSSGPKSTSLPGQLSQAFRLQAWQAPRHATHDTRGEACESILASTSVCSPICRCATGFRFWQRPRC